MGGTEVYVSALANFLHQEKHDVYFLKSSDKNSYDNKNKVFTISQYDRKENRLLVFDKILSELTPDVVHFHTISKSIGYDFLKISKSKFIKTFYTSHTPDLTCLRGDLLHSGNSICDGIMEKSKCLTCYKNSVPSNNYLIFQSLSNFVRNKFMMYESESSFISKFQFLSKNSEYLDKLIVVSNWQKQLLLKNGISESQIEVVPQGVDLKQINQYDYIKNDTNDLITIGFCARIDPLKGLHILIEAFERINQPNLRIHIIGITNNNNSYYKQLREKTSKYKNIIWELNLSRDEVFNSMKSFDALCIPSQWFETGPFTMYEAFALQIPIIASNLGGMSDNIIHNENGLLFDHDNVDDLAKKIKEFLENETLREMLKRSHMPKRDINQIGMDMLDIYNK